MHESRKRKFEGDPDESRIRSTVRSVVNTPYGSISLYDADLESLCSESQGSVTDHVINIAMYIACELGRRTRGTRWLYADSCAIAAGVSRGGRAIALRSLMKIDPKTTTGVLFPIHIASREHWILVVAVFKATRLVTYLYDPMNPRETDPDAVGFTVTLRKLYAATIVQYFDSVIAECHVDPDVRIIAGAPAQALGSQDCGIMCWIVAAGIACCDHAVGLDDASKRKTIKSAVVARRLLGEAIEEISQGHQ